MAGVLNAEMSITGADVRGDFNRFGNASEGRRSRQQRGIVTSGVRQKRSKTPFEVLGNAHTCSEELIPGCEMTHNRTSDQDWINSVSVLEKREVTAI